MSSSVLTNFPGTRVSSQVGSQGSYHISIPSSYGKKDRKRLSEGKPKTSHASPWWRKSLNIHSWYPGHLPTAWTTAHLASSPGHKATGLTRVWFAPSCGGRTFCHWDVSLYWRIPFKGQQFQHSGHAEMNMCCM